MSTEAKASKDKEALGRYFTARRDDLLKEHPELTTKRQQFQRMRSEWKLLSPEERLPYENESEKPAEANEIGVDDFLTAVKKERTKDEVDPEFEEDDVLSIVNHKSKWKLTYGKKKKMRVSNVANCPLRPCGCSVCISFLLDTGELHGCAVGHSKDMSAVGCDSGVGHSAVCNSPLVGDHDFNGPVVERKCTDWPLLLLFLVANLGLLAQSGYGFSCGQPGRLLHGWDFRGELCGQGELRSKPYTYFPIPDLTLDVGMCLEGCPILSTRYSVCYYDTDHVTDLLTLPCYSAYTAKPFFSRYCLPSDPAYRELVLDWLYGQQQISTRIAGDLIRGWDIVVVAGLLSLSVLLLLLLGLFTGKGLQWQGSTAVIMLGTVMGVLCYLVYEESERLESRICDTENSVVMEDCDSASISSPYQSFSYFLMVLFSLFILYLGLRLPRTLHLSPFISLTTQPMHSSPGLLCVLLTSLTLGTCVVTYLLVSILYLSSCGSVDTIETVIPGWHAKTIDFSVTTRSSVLYIVIMVTWWLSVIVTSVEYVTSYHAVTWFFSKDKRRLNQPIKQAIWTLFRYHFGSVVLNSLIVPGCRTLRNCMRLVTFLISKLSNTARSRVTTLCKPCLWLYNNFLCYLNSHTFPYQSLWGTSYFDSSKRGFYLLSRSPPQILTSAVSAETYIWPFQLILTLSGPVFVYAWVKYTTWTPSGEPTLHVTSVTALAGVVVVVTWFIGECFGGFMRGFIYGEAVSYAADREMFVGIQRFSDISFSLVFHEEVNLETAKNESIPSEESQQDLLEAVHPMKQHTKPETDNTLSSQISIVSDTSDEIRPIGKRTSTPTNPDTARNLSFPLPGQVPPHDSVPEILTPDDSFSSLEEEEVARPAARPPSRTAVRSTFPDIKKK